MKRPDRPAGVVVVAILQIVFGALGLLGNLCSGGMQLAGGNKMFAPPGGGAGAPGVPDVEAMLKARVPHYEAMLYGGIVLGLVSGTVMIVSGAGLLQMRPWARWLTIGYAFYNIASTIFTVIYNLVVTVPIVKEVFAQMRADPNFPSGGAPMLNMMETIFSVTPFLSLVFLAYPTVLLFIMFAPSVRAAFRGQEPRRFEDDDDGFDDDGFDDESAPPDDEGIRRGDR